MSLKISEVTRNHFFHLLYRFHHVDRTQQSSYDVFLSFRGEDTRSHFASHLYRTLCQRGVVIFNDDVDMRNGLKVTASLVRVIQKSRMAIIIFSRNYASSAFCLNELVQILKCHAEGRMRILLVFYDVHPSEVRNQSGSYGEAFAKHEERFNYDKDKLQDWRSALRSAANFSGYLHKRREEPEDVFIEKITERRIGWRCSSFTFNSGRM
ncbi:TMV resistance protein N-like [Vigna unguiculata]|uniref:TMV resistance protein N-like n=1 Tax=Vigna unguiculata TaxID=3917 RepID=UPI0010161DDC|nr:TMV resistance protein N-like [Vigna unguiculata]